MAPKSIKKALGFSVKVEVVLRLRKTSKKHWLHNVLELPEKLLKIPYKTCRLWRLLRPFSQNGSEKYQKSIRFFTKSHRPFCIFLHFTIFAISRKEFSHSLLPLGQFCCILQFPLSVFLFLSFIFLLEIWPPSFLRGGPPLSAGEQVDHPPETAPRYNSFGNWDFLKEYGIPLRNKNIPKDCKMLKKHWLHNVLELRKKLFEIPYKACRLWRLLGPFSPYGSKKYQKSIRFSVKVEVVLRLRKTSKKHWPHNVLELPEKQLEIPYKTCRLWRLLGPFSQNGSKKYQKALGFPLKDTGHSALSENLIKPIENEDFWEATSPPSELQLAGLRAQPGPAGFLFFWK